MQVLISNYHETAQCTWCQKTAESVTVEFDSGFLEKSQLCFKCLQQATRVHSKQSEAPKKPGREAARES